MKYVPLHLHTEYSLLDGAIKLKDLFKFASENDMPAVALTDHGCMYGVIDFYLQAKNYPDVKPLIGCEFYVCDGDVLNDKTTKKEMYHLVLLAKNDNGYQNLIKLASTAATQAFYYKPRINHEILSLYSSDLICLSACIQGEVAYHILHSSEEKALETAKWYKNLFGEDYYIELQDHGLVEQKKSNPTLIKIAKELSIKMVITNDSHYLKAEDALWHDTLLCDQTKSLKNDPHRFRFSNNEFYVKTVEQLRKSFSWMEDEAFYECINNTVEIADKCDVHIELGKTHIPEYPVPEGYTIESYFDYLCTEGLKRRYNPVTDAIKERYEYERGVIEKMGFCGYFIITWDFINWAKENGVPTGPGRGSAAGSIVAYALGITELDPIRHNLLFERFLNPERISMPDVDIDFCKRKRTNVIDYVTSKYGEDHVCQIITFGTLAAKAAIKSVARAYDIPFAESNKVSAMVPTGVKVKIDEALKDGMELKKLVDSDAKVKEWIEEARHLEGLRNQCGTHAAGVIISHKPLDTILPIALSKEKQTTTQYAMADIEKLGLLKMDFLGLETLTIIQDTLDLIKKRHNIDLEINKIPLDDPMTFDMLKRGDTDAVFQLESGGMKKLVKELKPTVFEDLGALVALFRPGPLNSGMVQEFVECKHGRRKITYPHPLLEPILKDTYGTMVYQEQIMQIVQVMADYTLGQADILRRAMGKKKLDVMEQQRANFIAGALKKGVPETVTNPLFDKMMNFAEYCFNRSHSAAYAFVAYQTAYLKAHYPVEFMCSNLTSQSNNQDKTQSYILQCQKLGIQVLPPDINKSDAHFTPDGKNIRFGLGSIKGVGAAVIEDIYKVKQEGDFESFFDFCNRVDAKCLNKKVLESLIKAGAFEGLEKCRKQLLNNIESVVEFVQRNKKDKSMGQVSLFDGLSDEAKDLNIPTFELQGSSDDEFSDSEIQKFEKELMGIYVSSHPLQNIKDSIKFLANNDIIELIETPKNEQKVCVCGLLSQVAAKPTKKDPTKILKTGFIEDMTGRIEFVAFPKTVVQFGDFLQSDEIVILNGVLQIRDEFTNLVVREVKPIENVNIVTLTMNADLKPEETVLLKEILAQYKGDCPLVVEYFENGEAMKILADNRIWVNATNELRNAIEHQFKDKIDVEIKSLT